MKIIPDIVSRFEVTSVAQNTLVSDSAKLMADVNIAALAVVDKNGKLTGIVTERDLTQRVLAADLDSRHTMVEDIMTINPDSLSSDDSPMDALELMQARGYRHLPITEDGRCISMVSIRDLYEAVRIALEQEIKDSEAFVFTSRYSA